MSAPRTIGFLGYGRIGKALHEFVENDPQFQTEYVYVRSEKDDLPDDQQLTDQSRLSEIPVDLCVEAATHEVVGDLGADVLQTSDLMVLSGSAFIDHEVESTLTTAAEENGTKIWLPHAALFGIDGLVDAGDTLNEVSIVATKAPDHLDYDYNDEIDESDVDGRTVLYEGPVRGLCELFPRNFNSHAAVAMAGLGLDETTSKLIADPAAETAHHVITAKGDTFELEAVRDSAIEGVTGDYTLISTWGSMRRVLDLDGAVSFV